MEINFHRVVEIKRDKIMELTGNYSFSIIVETGDGERIELSFFSKDKKALDIKLDN